MVRVHPDPPLNPLKSILSEDSENKFNFLKYTQLYTVDLLCIFILYVFLNLLLEGDKFIFIVMKNLLFLISLIFVSLNAEAKCFQERQSFNCYDNNRLYYSGTMTKSNKQNATDATYFSTGGVWDWLNLTGYGTYYYENGDVYTGRFLDRRKNGFGTYTWKDGKKYSGNWKKNKREGQGSYYSSEGNLLYSGNYKNDEKHGFGSSYGDKGKSYIGNWKYGKRHGEGTRYFYGGNWSSVTGNYSYGTWDGSMKAIYSPKNEILSAEGEIYCCVNDKYSWDGKVLITYKNGAILDRVYSKGTIVKSNWVITKEEANKELAEKQKQEQKRQAIINAENAEKKKKLKQEEEIYNQCILDKIPDAKTEMAANLIKKSCLEISKNPTRWQLIKYLGLDGLDEILN